MGVGAKNNFDCLPLGHGLLWHLLAGVFNTAKEGNRLLRTTPHRDGKVQIECGSRGELGRPLPQLLELNYEALEAAFEKAFEARTKETEE